ncbi:MAG TPA: hypothetical protein EYP14_12780 [Planctomycetaceae bacterium]|nr:hypothetical protein [Planctomycetaceae bacterium]
MIGRIPVSSWRRGGLLTAAIGIVLALAPIAFRDARRDALGDSARSGEASMSAIRIDADYSGGSILVERIEGDRGFLSPGLRDTKRGWFYWNFRAEQPARG